VCGCGGAGGLEHPAARASLARGRRFVVTVRARATVGVRAGCSMPLVAREDSVRVLCQEGGVGVGCE
jgi:hypothetical protein